MKKITLCCNAGMSTSLLVQKMQKDAQERNLDVTIEARPLNEIMDHLDTNVILLGPQIGYAKGELSKVATVPVEVIPMVDYGRMNAKGVNDFAFKLMGE